ncbi:hypothetical protein [Mesonia mobilis]|uniref:hypothetical protein n=1 Tax=Mesonia mobilis TaxID=369791 RepID=UPI0026EF690C|nr:hypothetical protein [Mesonia mobilis]
MSEFSLNNQVSIKNPHSRVSKWWGPYNSITEAKTETAAVRNIGFPVGIMQDGYVVEHIWQKVDDGFDFVKDGVFTTQTIDSGGNYTDLEVTADLLIFTNENAQAILHGVWGKKEFHILNLSETYEVEIPHNSESVSGNGNGIQLPTTMSGSVGIKGTARILFANNEYGYFVADTWGSTYRPEFSGLTENEVVIVGPDAKASTVKMFELEVFRDAQTTEMTKDQLNEAYPDAKRPFRVWCPQLSLYYVIVDDNNKNWLSYRGISVTNPA